MSYLSFNSATNLYWIGRYLQRAETMLKEYEQSYDYVIDRDFEDGKKLFAKFGEPIEYKNASDFLAVAVYGNHTLNIADMVANARENTVVCRDLIDDETFAAINSLNIKLKEGRWSNLRAYTINELLSIMRSIWGGLREPLIRPKAYYFVEFGDVIERIDLKIRLYEDLSNILFEIENINIIAHKLNPTWKNVKLTGSDKNKLLAEFNSLIDKIAYGC